MMFTHTLLERRMWRGWFRNGQSLELTWPRSSVGARVLIHSNDDDRGDRMLFLGLGFIGAYIPLGVVPGPYSVGDEPSWGVELSLEFGVNLHWGARRKHFYWPWDLDFVRASYLLADGTWRTETASRQAEVNRLGRAAALAYHKECWAARDLRWQEEHPYRYVLRSGELQERIATIRVDEREWRRRWLKWLPWGAKVVRTIDVEFDGEVGERSGSWKGGCVGCSYEMRPGEEPVDTLRRMEAERKF